MLTRPNKIGNIKMEINQEQHLQSIKDNFAALADLKYRKGQHEHGGNLWEKKHLIDMAIDEAIDQVCYLFSLKDQIQQSGIEFGTLDDTKK